MLIILLLTLISFSFAQDTLIRWEEEVNLTQDSIYNLYPWIECKDNYVHVLWAESYVYYQRSTDSGTTWSEPFRLNTDTTVIIHPKLALGGENVYCIWDAGYSGGWHLRFTRSTNSGETWDSVITLDDSVCCKAMIAASGDTVFIVEHMPDTIFQLRRSFDGGVNWSSPYLIIKMPPLYYPGLSYFNNVLHLAFVCYDLVYYMYSTDLGETWSDSLQIAINPDAPKCRNIVANDYGYLFVPWSDNKYSGGIMDDILLRRSTDDGLTWLAEQQITNHHLVKYWDDICCTDSDVYLVWPKGGTEDALQFRASTDMGETWWEIENICDTITFAPTITTAAVATTTVHVAWDDNRIAPSEIYYRRGTRLPVGIEETAMRSMPDALRLRVYPNPFSKLITINFGKGHPGRITSSSYGTGRAKGIELKIFDITGKEVVVLGHQNIRESGYQGNQVVWNGRDKNELQVPAGVYFVQVKAGNECIIKKVVKLK